MEESKQVAKKATGITLRFLITVALFTALLWLFYFLADEIVLERNNTFDAYIFQELSDITSASITRLMLFFTFLGSNVFLLPSYIILILYFLFVRKNTRLSLDTAMVGLTSTGLLFLMKDIFHRQRPLDPLIKNVSGYSFPSGHSFSAFTFFGLIIYFIWQTKIRLVWKWLLAIFFLLLAVCVATSRVYLHVHYASDVLGGICLSAMWLIISLLLLHKIDSRLFINTREK
ncbi:MAG: phosphatase PAP2 family protein [Ginsengibacter sp.]